MPVHVSVFVVGLLTIGSAMSLLTKYQDMQCVKNCDDPATRVSYEQPVLQTVFMFCGEILCIVPAAYLMLSRKLNSPPIQLPADETDITKPALKKISIFWFLIPSFCDIFATTLMNLGLMLTPVSVFQMSRGSLVLFTGIFGRLFLKRKLKIYQWSALVIAFAGVCLVGLSTKLKATVPQFVDAPQYRSAFLGFILIVLGQIFTATQFTFEENLMANAGMDTAVAVALEGVFGLLLMAVSVPVVHHFTKHEFFDLSIGWEQTVRHPNILLAAMALSVTIACFNYFGMSITRRVNATTRTLTDACRALVQWAVSLWLGWEALSWAASPLQMTGYFFLLYGTLLFSSLVPIPFRKPVRLDATRQDDDGEA
ncbi:hypothetical protein R3P38DRAFT_2842789 [Favolaschia claudopus]|uniref:Solute carrier family 35 member F6 n=1 Tax=Favolaschia claudopus TaxID=2862362 RepID=A0AAW0E1T6_9AGAR